MKCKSQLISMRACKKLNLKERSRLQNQSRHDLLSFQST